MRGGGTQAGRTHEEETHKVEGTPGGTESLNRSSQAGSGSSKDTGMTVLWLPGCSEKPQGLSESPKEIQAR